jgi:hypothetical protein
LLLLGQDLGAALGEGPEQVPVMEAVDLRRPGALVDRPPAHFQPAGHLRPKDRVVQPVGGHGVGVQLPRVQRRPAPIRTYGGVLNQQVGVPVRVALLAGPRIERGRGDPASAEPVDAVVAPADPDRLLFQPAEHLPDGGIAGGLDLRPRFRWASGREQAHAFRIRERQIKARDPRSNPLADMLARFRKGVAIQFIRISIKDRPAQPFHHHRRELPGTGNTLQLVPHWLAGCQLTDLNSREAATSRSAAWSGPASSLERGSARRSGVTRCSPVRGS